MFTFLKKIMQWSLSIICLVLVLALLVFAIWWLDLPMMGIFIGVCAIAALVVLFFAGRRLKVWLNKRSYVKQVLTQNPIPQDIAAQSQNPMVRAWHAGMDVFTHSSDYSVAGTKKIDAIYKQSWALMLGRDSCESQSLIHTLTGSAIAKSNLDDPLRWHFLPDLVLLEADASLLSVNAPLVQSQWEEFLIQVTNHRAKEPINALIITINAKDIYAYDTQRTKETDNMYSEKPELETSQVADLREYGNLLRSRIGQVLAISSAKLPVYVLVNGVNGLRGMSNLPLHLPASTRKKLLGACFDVASNTEFAIDESIQENALHNVRTLAKQSINNAVNDIRVFIANEAVKGNFPEQDELYAPILFQRLEEGLCIFLESLMRPTPHGLSPLLRCIAFTCTVNEYGDAYGQAVHISSVPNEISNSISHSPIMANSGAMHLSLNTTPVASAISNSAGSELIGKGSLISAPLIPMSNMLKPISLNMASPALSANISSLDTLQNVQHNEHEHSPMAPQFRKKLDQACFISDLFTKILPTDRLLYQPLSKTSVREAWIFPSFLGYYLLLFTFCAMLAINTIYTIQTLEGINTASKADSVIIPIPEFLKPLQQSYQRISYLDEAQSSWIFPFTGQNRIDLEQEKEEDNFINIMRNSVLPIILRDVTENNASLAVSAPIAQGVNRKDSIPPAFEDLKRIIWMQEAISLRTSHETSFSMRAKPFPITRYSGNDEDLWGIGFGELFLYFVDLNSVESLSSLQTYLRSVVQNILDKNGEHFFAQMESIVNAEIPTAAIPISRFWPAMPGGSPNFTSIPPIYTAEGFNRMQTVISTIWELNHTPENKMEDNPYWQQYLMRYAMAWADFVAYTDYAWANVTRISTLKDMVEISKSKQGPYVRILSTMSENLEPLRNNPVAPQWVEEIFLFNALTELASLAAESDVHSFLTTPAILMNTIKSSPKNMEIFRKLMEEHSPSVLVDTISALAIYFNALKDIRMTLASEEGSFELARLQFGGEEYGSLAESHFTIAQNSLWEALFTLGISIDSMQDTMQATTMQYNPESPAVFLIQGPYRFLSHALSCVAAQRLQRIWEASVMPAATLLPPETAPQMLFNEQGIITTFLANEAAPFFHRQVGYYEANSFAGNIFPFTVSFLNFIQQGQEIKQVEPKESYEVTLISQTGNLNSDATEYLQYLELSLNCQKETYTLRNSNYPESAVFSYDPKLCTNVSLDFYFPSLHLQYEYADFPEFLRDFSYGEREFSIYDFPERAEAMEKLDIRRINVRILPENASDILNRLDTVLVPLPARICGVW